MRQSKYLQIRKLNGRVLILAGFGTLGLGTALFLFRFWQGVMGSVPLDARPFLAELIGILAGLCGLLLYSYRKDERLNSALAPAPTEYILSREEKSIVAALAADPFSLAEDQIAESVGLSANRFRLHWHRLSEELKLVECEERRCGINLYVLSQRGRKYANEYGLL